jgi:3-mercaptopyruvate sulfurtransferase SseA
MSWKLFLPVLWLSALLGGNLAGQAVGRKQAKQKTPPVVVQEEKTEPVPEGRISIQELKRKLDAKEKIVILDNRTGSSWIGSLVKIKGAIHMPGDQVSARIEEIPKDREVITYCT